MNKLFDAQSWRNRLTALGVILDLKPLPEDVTLRVPADQINQVSCGRTARQIDSRLDAPKAAITAGIGAEKVVELGGSTQPQATIKGRDSLPLSSPSRSAPKYSGAIMESAVIRAEERAKLFKETTGNWLPDMVCKNPECGKVSTILFSCHFCPECKDECQECYDLHMDADHESDSSTAREQYQGIHLLAKGEQS